MAEKESLQALFVSAISGEMYHIDSDKQLTLSGNKHEAAVTAEETVSSIKLSLNVSSIQSW